MAVHDPDDVRYGGSKMQKYEVGDRFESDPCPRCECQATGRVAGFSQFNGESVEWDPPPDDCACVCHDAWRFVNRPAKPRHLSAVAS